jgi:hypothetical protein
MVRSDRSHRRPIATAERILRDEGARPFKRRLRAGERPPVAVSAHNSAKNLANFSDALG